MSNYDKSKENECISDSEFREKHCKKMDLCGFQAAAYFFCTDTGLKDDVSALALSYAMDCAKRYVAEIEGEIENTDEDSLAETDRLHTRLMSEVEKCLENSAPYLESANLFIEIAKIGCGDLFRTESE